MVIGRVEGDATRELIHLNAALLPEEGLSDEERGAVGCTVDPIDTQVDPVEGDMVIVETLRLRLEPVIVSQGTVVPVDTSHLIDIVTDINIGLTGHKPVDIASDIQCVARQMEFEVGLADGETIRIDAPLQGRGGGICGSGITECDIQTGLHQAGAIYLYCLLVEIDPLRREPQFLQATLDAQVADKPIGVDTGLLE